VNETERRIAGSGCCAFILSRYSMMNVQRGDTLSVPEIFQIDNYNVQTG